MKTSRLAYLWWNKFITIVNITTQSIFIGHISLEMMATCVYCRTCQTIYFHMSLVPVNIHRHELQFNVFIVINDNYTGLR